MGGLQVEVDVVLGGLLEVVGGGLHVDVDDHEVVVGVGIGVEEVVGSPEPNSHVP